MTAEKCKWKFFQYLGIFGGQLVKLKLQYRICFSMTLQYHNWLVHQKQWWGCWIFFIILPCFRWNRVCKHDDVIKWKHFLHYWPFVRGIHRSPLNSPHKGQWRGALMFSLICVWINGWVNNREAGDLRRYRAHYDIVMKIKWCMVCCESWFFLVTPDLPMIFTGDCITCENHWWITPFMTKNFL